MTHFSAHREFLTAETHLANAARAHFLAKDALEYAAKSKGASDVMLAQLRSQAAEKRAKFIEAQQRAGLGLALAMRMADA